MRKQASFAWDNYYGHVLLAWIRIRLAFAVIHATDLCLCGLRVRRRSETNIDD